MSEPHLHAAAQASAPARMATVTTVALLPWGLLYDEDFLDTLGVSLAAFSTEMTGGYLFNYVEALRHAGIRSVIVLVSARVEGPTRMTHVPTGATIVVLPPPAAYAALRAGLRGAAVTRLLRPLPRLAALVEEIAAYASTPRRALLRELRQEGCSAILCQEYEYTRFDDCVLLARRDAIPVFATFQGGDRPWGLLQRIVRPWTLKRVAGLIIGPRREAERVRARYGVSGEKIARIFNPLDEASFAATPRREARRSLGLPPRAGVVAWYGRVEKHTKGLDVLMDAWALLCAERPAHDLHLLMVGTGRDAGWLHERLLEGGLRGVRWRDAYVHDRSVLRLHLSACDVFAFPSRHEGFPVAPMEAMACGVPVVAADAPGVPDILEGGEAGGGLIVPKDDAGALAAALGRLLDDPDRARRLGARGRVRARAAFSLESVGRQLGAFLVERARAHRRDGEVR